MIVQELINKLETCKPSDNITFYYLQNDSLTNCQFESLIWCDQLELTIQNTSDFIANNPESMEGN